MRPKIKVTVEDNVAGNMLEFYIRFLLRPLAERYDISIMRIVKTAPTDGSTS